MATHSVENQPPPLANYDVFDADLALTDAVSREGAGWAVEELRALGVLAGSEEAQAWGTAANEFPPKLRTHDRYGNRIDEVDYHPAYHELMRVALAHGLHTRPWSEPCPGAHVARAAGFMVWSQVDAGHGCPVSMTYAVVPALAAEPTLALEWEPRLFSRHYDKRALPAAQKTGATAGMAMTEKQGGSDVRANTTRAEPVAAATGSGAEYLLTGHKWFCSAPMGDLFLVLAQAPGGLSCFAVPRWTPDGNRNVFRLQRLKDKLGNRSNASSEVEFSGTWARMLGPEGRGVPTIIEMVNHTRLDCILGSTSLMRQAVAQSTHHAAHRVAFGRELSHQPLMRAVLADLAIESEAATVTALRIARAYDAPAEDAHEHAFRRVATAVSKYWVCKRAPGLAAEALECLGGNGYVEESGMPRLLRESPLNGIWEGSGNVICLDVLRAMSREPDAIAAFRDEINTARGTDRRLDVHLDVVDTHLTELDDVETRARRIVEDLALALQASLLVQNAPADVADAFCGARLGPDRGWAYGSLDPAAAHAAIVERATPAVDL